MLRSFMLYLLISTFSWIICAQDTETEIYTDVSIANNSDSIFRIKNAPLKVYEFKYDR